MTKAPLHLTLVFVVCAACSGHPGQAAPVAVVPCAVPGVGSPDSVWHQVRASGFTFCVPASWRPSGHPSDSLDAQRWKGEGGSVTWGLGRPAIGVTTRGEVRGVIVRGTAMTDATERGCSQSNTPLTADTVVLVITQVLCRGTWTTTAWSTAPAIYVQGVTQSAEATERLLLVLQTIRVKSSAP